MTGTIRIQETCDAAYGIAEIIFMEDAQGAASMLDKVVPAWHDLPAPAQQALFNMAFNLGYRLRTFERMLEAVGGRDFSGAAREAVMSLWSKQVGQRATRVRDLFLEAAKEEQHGK